MKVWMMSVCYLPMIVSYCFTPAAELEWALPVYIFTAVGMLLSIGVLCLMTYEPSTQDSAEKEQKKSCITAPLRTGQDVPLMQMHLQGTSSY